MEKVVQVHFGLMPMSEKEFGLITNLVYKHFGISLDETKRSLVIGRLNKIVKDGGFNSFEEYYHYIVNDKSGSALTTLGNRISTNHTYFNREPDHFDYLMKVVLPEIDAVLTRKNSRDLRMWCAAASTGEEPYMLAMLILEYFGAKYINWKAGLLATDISLSALTNAQSGVYSNEQLTKLDKKLINKYFLKLDDNTYCVSPKLKQEVVYRRFNLMTGIFPFKHAFDIIFCRNVMIYFDEDTKHQLAEKMYNNTNTGGYLFIGHSETLRRNKTQYKYIKPAVYKKEN